MTIASELEALQTNLNNAYTAIENKGGTLPEVRSFENLSLTITDMPASATLQTKNAIENGLLEPDEGYDGLSSVNVMVPSVGSSVTALNTLSSSVSANSKVWLEKRDGSGTRDFSVYGSVTVDDANEVITFTNRPYHQSVYKYFTSYLPTPEHRLEIKCKVKFNYVSNVSGGTGLLYGPFMSNHYVKDNPPITMMEYSGGTGGTIRNQYTFSSKNILSNASFNTWYWGKFVIDVDNSLVISSISTDGVNYTDYSESLQSSLITAITDSCNAVALYGREDSTITYDLSECSIITDGVYVWRPYVNSINGWNIVPYNITSQNSVTGYPSANIAANETGSVIIGSSSKIQPEKIIRQNGTYVADGNYDAIGSVDVGVGQVGQTYSSINKTGGALLDGDKVWLNYREPTAGSITTIANDNNTDNAFYGPGCFITPDGNFIYYVDGYSRLHSYEINTGVNTDNISGSSLGYFDLYFDDSGKLVLNKAYSTYFINGATVTSSNNYDQKYHNIRINSSGNVQKLVNGSWVTYTGNTNLIGSSFCSALVNNQPTLYGVYNGANYYFVRFVLNDSNNTYSLDNYVNAGSNSMNVHAIGSTNDGKYVIFGKSYQKNDISSSTFSIFKVNQETGALTAFSPNTEKYNLLGAGRIASFNNYTNVLSCADGNGNYALIKYNPNNDTWEDIEIAGYSVTDIKTPLCLTADELLGVARYDTYYGGFNVKKYVIANSGGWDIVPYSYNTSNSLTGYASGTIPTLTYGNVIVGTKIEPTLSTLNVTPTTSAQSITPTSPDDGFDEVNVSAVTASIDQNIVASNIKKDVEILGVTGNYEGESPTLVTKTITENGTYDASSDSADGYSEVTVNVPGVDIVNAKNTTGAAITAGDKVWIEKVSGVTGTNKTYSTNGKYGWYSGMSTDGRYFYSKTNTDTQMNLPLYRINDFNSWNIENLGNYAYYSTNGMYQYTSRLTYTEDGNTFFTSRMGDYAQSSKICKSPYLSSYCHMGYDLFWDYNNRALKVLNLDNGAATLSISQNLYGGFSGWLAISNNVFYGPSNYRYTVDRTNGTLSGSWYGISGLSESITNLVGLGVTSDSKYMLFTSYPYSNNNQFFLRIAKIETNGYLTFSQTGYPERMQKAFQNTTTGKFYTFNSTNDVLTFAEISSGSDPVYGFFKYDKTTDSWSEIFVDLSTALDDVTQITGMISTTTDMTKISIPVRTTSDSADYSRLRIIQIKNESDFRFKAYNYYDDNSTTLTGFATENIASGSFGNAKTVLPDEIGVDLYADDENAEISVA